MLKNKPNWKFVLQIIGHRKQTSKNYCVNGGTRSYVCWIKWFIKKCSEGTLPNYVMFYLSALNNIYRD